MFFLQQNPIILLYSYTVINLQIYSLSGQTTHSRADHGVVEPVNAHLDIKSGNQDVLICEFCQTYIHNGRQLSRAIWKTHTKHTHPHASRHTRLLMLLLGTLHRHSKSAFSPIEDMAFVSNWTSCPQSTCLQCAPEGCISQTKMMLHKHAYKLMKFTVHWCFTADSVRADVLVSAAHWAVNCCFPPANVTSHVTHKITCQDFVFVPLAKNISTLCILNKSWS